MSEFQDHSQLQENKKSKFISRSSELISFCIYIKTLQELIVRYKLGNYEGEKYQNCEIKKSVTCCFYYYIYISISITIMIYYYYYLNCI